MTLSEQLDFALRHSGYQGLRSPRAYRKIGQGAWHTAYLVTSQTGARLVVRLRQAVIYGRHEAFEPQALHEDYAPVGCYYQHANQIQPGICPTVYSYIISPEVSGTIESYMGRSEPLDTLTPSAATHCGEHIGRFFRAVHSQAAPIPGMGSVVWEDGVLRGADQRPQVEVWQSEAQMLWTWWEQLAQAVLGCAPGAPTSQHPIGATLRHILDTLDGATQPTILANGDITPENLILREGQLAGLVDPVPHLHRPTRYAAFFPYCYHFLLPALSPAPRYARHNFAHHAPTLGALADGYLAGYTEGDHALAHTLDQEYFLWLLEGAFEDWERLQGDISPETFLRTGGQAVLAANLNAGLQQLAALTHRLG